MNAETAVGLLQRMHGVALHCLTALMIGHFLKGLDIVSDGNICDWTGRSQDAVSKGMRLLLTIVLDGAPLVDRLGLNPNRWRLSAAGRQLGLPLAGFLGDPSTGSGQTPFKTESLPMYGGVVVNNREDSYVLTTPTPNSTLTPLLAESLDKDTARVMRLLLRLDVWPNVARDVAGLLEDDDYVNLRDVLGWIVYCRDARNRIANPAAVVCANLRARQRPSSRYRAAFLCGSCRRMETMCTCAAPDLYLPEEFDDLAFEDNPLGDYGREDWLAHLWFCVQCGGRPCVCPSQGDHDEH